MNLTSGVMMCDIVNDGERPLRSSLTPEPESRVGSLLSTRPSASNRSVDRPRCAPRHHRPPPRATAGASLPSHHRTRPTAARVPRPTFRARVAAGRGDAPACCHHDAANYSYDLLLLTTAIDYVRTNARKPSASIRTHVRPHRRDHGRRALHGHLQAAGARRVRRRSGRGDVPRGSPGHASEDCRRGKRPLAASGPRN